ncbi:hypothetical protein PM082_002593 [Marasmius tenuissimus]|nr:hypothetical protein PM082_002593 [Marasmius tenuissimus]
MSRTRSKSSEEAVEFDELDKFFRLKETWDPEIDHHAELEEKPIGVPGAFLPLQMTPDHIKKLALNRNPSPSSNQIPVNKRTDMFDVSTELSGYGLQGVHASEQELIDLVKELGLEGDDAGELVKGLSTESAPEVKASEPKASDSKPAPEPKTPEAKPDTNKDSEETKPKEAVEEKGEKATTAATVDSVDTPKE